MRSIHKRRCLKIGHNFWPWPSLPLSSFSVNGVDVLTFFWVTPYLPVWNDVVYEWPPSNFVLALSSYKTVQVFVVDHDNDDISVSLGSLYGMEHPKKNIIFQSFVLSTLLTIVNCGLTSYKVCLDQKFTRVYNLVPKPNISGSDQVKVVRPL